MASSDILIQAFEAVRRRFDQTLQDVTPEQLAHRPDPEANSIAWLGWHLTRWQDTQVSSFAGRDQAWVSDGWAAKFGRNPDPRDTGIGHTSSDVAGLQATAQLLLDYHAAVSQRTLAYLKHASDAELEREVVNQLRGTTDIVRNRLVGVLSDNFQHVGQMAYLRGLLAGEHWGGH